MEHIGGIGAVSIVVAIVFAAYYFLLLKYGLFKPAIQSTSGSVKETPSILPIIGPAVSSGSAMPLPPSVEAPVINFEDMEIEFIEDESNILLKEAERVVERIQQTLDHIATNPPNPEEVTSKIRALVVPYQIFLDTEYYDSINTYISLAVERDCSIKLSPDELKAMWN